MSVWTISLEQPAIVQDRLLQLLNPQERERAARFRSLPARRQFIIGRSCLRAILSQFLNVPLTEIRFDAGGKGKPFLHHEMASTLEFNLSHSGDMAAIGVTRNRVLGIDIEQVREITDFEALVTRFFSPTECAAFAQLEADVKLPGFFRTWTRKEAFIKATGQGLSRSLESFDVGVHPNSPPGLLRVVDDPDEPGRWTMIDFMPREDLFGSLIVAGQNVTARFQSFDPQTDI